MTTEMPPQPGTRCPGSAGSALTVVSSNPPLQRMVSCPPAGDAKVSSHSVLPPRAPCGTQGLPTPGVPIVTPRRSHGFPKCLISVAVVDAENLGDNLCSVVSSGDIIFSNTQVKSDKPHFFELGPQETVRIVLRERLLEARGRSTEYEVLVPLWQIFDYGALSATAASAKPNPASSGPLQDIWLSVMPLGSCSDPHVLFEHCRRGGSQPGNPRVKISVRAFQNLRPSGSDRTSVPASSAGYSMGFWRSTQVVSPRLSCPGSLSARNAGPSPPRGPMQEALSLASPPLQYVPSAMPPPSSMEDVPKLMECLSKLQHQLTEERFSKKEQINSFVRRIESIEATSKSDHEEMLRTIQQQAKRIEELESRQALEKENLGLHDQGFMVHDQGFMGAQDVEATKKVASTSTGLMDVAQMRSTLQEHESVLAKQQATIDHLESVKREQQTLLSEKEERICELESQIQASVTGSRALPEALPSNKSFEGPIISPAGEDAGVQWAEADEDDEVDRMLRRYLKSHGIENNFQRLTPGRYLYGDQKILLKVLNGRLIVRVGGGYLPIEIFLSQAQD